MDKRSKSIEQLKDGSYLASLLFDLEYVKLIQRCAVWFVTSMMVYVLWILNLSIAPVFLLLLVVALHHEREKQRSNQHLKAASIFNKKKIVESFFQPDSVPPWILFPDKERAEWINTIIEQIWPNIGAFIRDIIFGKIEPEVKKALKAYKISGFCFKTIALGRIPPRVTGIKVYDKKDVRNRIIIDVDLLFASDCDITISLKGLDMGVKDIKFKGVLRIELKPLITEVPLFETAEVYFLTTPTIEFDLIGIANVLDITGTSSILHEAILEIMKELIVFPNKIRVFERD